MKHTNLLPFLLFIFFISCKNEAKNSELTTETETTLENPTEDLEEEPEINMGDIMNVMGGLLTGNTAKDSTGQGLFTAEGQLNVEGSSQIR